MAHPIHSFRSGTSTALHYHDWKDLRSDTLSPFPALFHCSYCACLFLQVVPGFFVQDSPPAESTVVDPVSAAVIVRHNLIEPYE